MKTTRDSTAKNYYGIWKKFNCFVVKLDRKPKSWERKVALYGAYLVDNGIQSSTIKSYFSAIKKILWEGLSYEFNDSHMLLASIAKACRIKNDKVYTRLPILVGMLDLILNQIGKMFENQVYLKTLYRTIFSFAFYGLLRIGEIAESPHVAKAKDVNAGVNKEKILIILYLSKTHGEESRPQRVKISQIGQMIRRYSPFQLMSKYSKIRSEIMCDEEQFFVFRDRSPVKPSDLRMVLAKAIKGLGLNHKNYSFHSLRIGMASWLIKLGYPIEVVKRLGRWKSNAIYRYIRN